MLSYKKSGKLVKSAWRQHVKTTLQNCQHVMYLYGNVWSYNYWTDVRDLCRLQSVFPRDRKVAVVED